MSRHTARKSLKLSRLITPDAIDHALKLVTFIGETMRHTSYASHGAMVIDTAQTARRIFMDPPVKSEPYARKQLRLQLLETRLNRLSKEKDSLAYQNTEQEIEVLLNEMAASLKDQVDQ